MFTGIIEQLGIVKTKQEHKNLIVLGIDAGKLSKEVKLGDSVAVNGVCLTVRQKKGTVLIFDLMRETIEKTSLKQALNKTAVNLELALKANSRLGGHFVSGHVDEVGVITSIVKEPNWVAITISVPKSCQKYLAPKGSVTVDGISLTIGKVSKGHFEVYLIPHTLKVTNLSQKKVGDWVNLETDILAKYLLASKS